MKNPTPTQLEHRPDLVRLFNSTEAADHAEVFSLPGARLVSFNGRVVDTFWSIQTKTFQTHCRTNGGEQVGPVRYSAIAPAHVHAETVRTFLAPK